MTDIQFLINLIINHSLTEDAKKLCLERIGEIEARHIKPSPAPVSNPVYQAVQQAPIHTPSPPPVARNVIPMEVETGKGTRGPRKF